MRYTIRHQGRVLGTTALDCYQRIHGQHSGWFFPGPGAELVLDAVSIKSAYIRAWMLRGDTLGDGGRVDDEEPAAPFAHDFAVMCQWNPETGEESTTSMDDDEWRKFVEARWLEAEESRYQVHLRLENPDDLPSPRMRLTEKAK